MTDKDAMDLSVNGTPVDIGGQIFQTRGSPSSLNYFCHYDAKVRDF